MNKNLQTALEAIEEASKEMNDKDERIEHLEKEVKLLEDDAKDLDEVESIELDGGTILVNLEDCNYNLRESFRQWCRSNAITNSEPLFNF